MSNSQPYQILNLRARDIVFKKCQCKGSIGSAVNSKFSKEDELLYCNNCQKLVHEIVKNFKIELVLLNIFENQIEEVTMYDEVANEFLGCTPDEYLEYVNKDRRLYEKLENMARGLFVDAEIIKNKRGQLKVKSCVNQNRPTTKLIRVLTCIEFL